VHAANLPSGGCSSQEPGFVNVTSCSCLSGSTHPANEELHIQKARNKSVTKNHQASLFSRAAGDIDNARLLAALIVSHVH